MLSMDSAELRSLVNDHTNMIMVLTLESMGGTNIGILASGDAIASGKLIDLDKHEVIWDATARVRAEGGGLIGALATRDTNKSIACIALERLLSLEFWDCHKGFEAGRTIHEEWRAEFEQKMKEREERKAKRVYKR
jgi:hypothetical protein